MGWNIHRKGMARTLYHNGIQYLIQDIFITLKEIRAIVEGGARKPVDFDNFLIPGRRFISPVSIPAGATAVTLTPLPASSLARQLLNVRT